MATAVLARPEEGQLVGCEGAQRHLLLRTQGKKADLREMYEDWPFFQSTMDLIEMILAKADMRIAQMYDERLVQSPSQRALGALLRECFMHTVQAVLQVPLLLSLMCHLFNLPDSRLQSVNYASWPYVCPNMSSIYWATFFLTEDTIMFGWRIQLLQGNARIRGLRSLLKGFRDTAQGVNCTRLNKKSSDDRALSVVQVTGHQRLCQNNPTLRRLIEMRNPYIDPINILQVRIPFLSGQQRI